jgi:hypothetical protein
MYFNYDHVAFRYEPFPIGLAKPILEPSTYREMTRAFPPLDRLLSYEAMGKAGRKYTLSERESTDSYNDFVRSAPLWRDFHAWVKSDAFIHGALDMLKAHDIDLGYERMPTLERRRRKLSALLRGRGTQRFERLTSRFEFSALPADGGNLVPHTDSASKIVTMVVAMLDDGEWDPAWGGGLDVNRPLSQRLAYNQVNRLARFEDMEVLQTFEFTPNQAVIFVKTFNSWHSVRPMRGQGSTALRKTLTIVIEAGA